jgi:NAD(P)-dependent dehydrogenase (short-subunit alcohol dehydrogenase family)
MQPRELKIMKKTIVITGASGGVGAAAARRLAANGHRVVAVGHSPAKTEAVARRLGIEFYIADFAKLSEVRALADQLLAKYPHIDVLANNAGAVFGRLRRATQDRHEMTFQVNYLASYLLTARLLDRLIESQATVIFTSSSANSVLGRIDINDLDNKANYSPLKAYGDSKLAQILFVRELHRRYRDSGLAAVTFAPCGIVPRFAFNPDSPLGWMSRISLPQLLEMLPGASGAGNISEMGADTLAFLAEGSAGLDFPAGEFFVERTVAKPNKQAFDRALGRELWARSEAMVEDFAFQIRTRRISIATQAAYLPAIVSVAS